MNEPSRYWTQVRIRGSQCHFEEVEEAKVFFHQHFNELVNQEQYSDREIQTQLVHWLNSLSEVNSNHSNSRLGRLCLRCYISNVIYQVCLDLEQKFGKLQENDGRQDSACPLLDVLLWALYGTEDSLTHRSNQEQKPQSLINQIIQTFDPQKSNLSTWTTRIVKTNSEIKRLLLEQGIELITDWSILNNRSPGGLQRILTEFSSYSPREVDQAAELLEYYHQIYRRQILEERKQQGLSQSRRSYPTPSTEQLSQIAQLLLPSRQLSPEEVLEELKNLAKLIRQYRIYKKTGNLPTESFGNLELTISSTQLTSSTQTEEVGTLINLWKPYSNRCLLQAVEKAIQSRFEHLHRKNPHKAQLFLKGLYLFHCKGIPMGEITPHLGLKAQYQVSRLLELKQLRADVHRHMFVCCRECILRLVTEWDSSNNVENLDGKLHDFLDKQTQNIIKEAEKEALNSKSRAMNSDFSLTVCKYLDYLIG